MASPRKIDFDDLDSLRVQVGLFVSQASSHLGISPRTWHRWGETGYAPKWAYVALYALSGDLTPLGWRGWYIKDGELYCRDLNPRYYSFIPAHLLASVFCQCPAHNSVRRTQSQGELDRLFKRIWKTDSTGERASEADSKEYPVIEGQVFKAASSG